MRPFVHLLPQGGQDIAPVHGAGDRCYFADAAERALPAG